MIKIEHIQTGGFEPAIRGMRNPMNSWEKSDSSFYLNGITIGDNDLKLMQSLIKSGPDHSKFRRMIVIYCDVTAPLYWWKEFETYKVGTVANSCSTMHKIQSKAFTLSDFAHENLSEKSLDNLRGVISVLNYYRESYLISSDKREWWQMIQLLPSSYLQKRTVMLNYEVMANITKARGNHKLDEWRQFVHIMAETLPYFDELIKGGNKNDV